jgi:hypothetical protein
MISAGLDYWDFDRASYEDELDAWRDRTAARVEPGRFGQVSAHGLVDPIQRHRRPVRGRWGRAAVHEQALAVAVSEGARAARRPTSPSRNIRPARQVARRQRAIHPSRDS